MRVNGRLERSDMSFDEKHPIVLPKNNGLSELSVRHVHNKTVHGGVWLMLTRLRTKFWVVQGQQLVRITIRRCIKCRRIIVDRWLRKWRHCQLTESPSQAFWSHRSRFGWTTVRWRGKKTHWAKYVHCHFHACCYASCTSWAHAVYIVWVIYTRI